MSVVPVLVHIATLLLLLELNDAPESAEAMQLPTFNIGPRIVGGRPARVNEFPYQVQLLIKNTLCGGSIIDNAHVLTAAHCVLNDNKVASAKYVTIYAGHIKQNAGTIYDAKYIFTHDKYNVNSVENDIALIRVSKNFTFSNSIQPIPLQRTLPQTVNTICQVSGWGAENDALLKPSLYLLAVDVPLINLTTCRRYYEGHLKSGMICAGDISKDACQGDSGGPLACNGMLTGIVSWGQGCGKMPGVYSSVPYYRNWINRQIQRSSSSHNLLSIKMLTICLIILITSYKSL